jgi:cell division transport system ATP-binding protein
MIHFDKVTKRYSNGHEAVSQIGFDLQPGEMAFLTGHSGAGKSTVLKLIAMMERPSSGQVILNGHNLNRINANKVSQLRRSIGIIFQQPRLLNNRSIFDNIALPLMINGYSPKEMSKRVRAALDKVGLLPKEKLLPADLSGGEQQRVGIARAIVHKPILLLADEPTGNLDPTLSAEIMRLFAEFHQVGVAVLIASHDLGLIATMRHRIILLKQGRLISDGR